MADNVNATPSEVRELARDIAYAINKLMDLNEYVSSGLSSLSKTFQDEGFEEYQESIKDIQNKLERLTEEELVIALKELAAFADLLEAAERA